MSIPGWCRFGAVAVLGNAEPLNMWRVKMTPGPGTAGPYGASYAGHLSENEHKFFTKITNDYQVVLFHYVTRSQNSFVERKINRRSGVYATTYAELAEKDKSASELLSVLFMSSLLLLHLLRDGSIHMLWPMHARSVRSSLHGGMQYMQ